jgi:DNA-binding Lrp family transcriptional regulator
MRLQDVLAAVPGVEKRFVHYLESQGYIHPQKLQKARIARRDYSAGDVERVRGIWRYYQRGMSVQRAYELVARPPIAGAYVLFPVPARRRQEALDLLREDDLVLEASIVYGESADVLARLQAHHESDVHAVLDRLFNTGIVAGIPQVHRYVAAPQALESDGEQTQGKRMRAWVLIKVPAKQIGGLVDELRSYPGVVEASAIYGETDVIAKVEVPDQDALDELVFHRIQSIEAVESTRTFIAAGAMQWQREPAAPRNGAE